MTTSEKIAPLGAPAKTLLKAIAESETRETPGLSFGEVVAALSAYGATPASVVEALIARGLVAEDDRGLSRIPSTVADDVRAYFKIEPAGVTHGTR